jgi:hypothetical protein
MSNVRHRNLAAALPHSMNQDQSEANDFALLRGALAAHDNESKLWPKESVEYARKLFLQARGSVPTIERVVQEVGLEQAEKLAPQVVEQRKFKNALLGYGSPCHYCNSEAELVRWDFALMKVSESKLSIGATLASAAASALTAPLLGAAAVRLPSRDFSGQALHLRLVTCKPCCKKHGNFIGLFMLNEERAARHPLWQALHEHGFTKFLPEEKMPDSFKYNFGRDL